MRILLADGHKWFRSVLQLYLESERQFEIVGGAKTVTSLLSMAISVQPDLILLDWQLSGIDTMETRRNVLTELHQIHPCVLIILLSVDANVSCSSVCREADMCVSLAEPPERLLAALHWAQQQIQSRVDNRECRIENVDQPFVAVDSS